LGALAGESNAEMGEEERYLSDAKEQESTSI